MATDSDYSIQSDVEFPYAGGVGVIIFYVIGSALMIGAITLLIVKAVKGKSNKENERESNEEKSDEKTFNVKEPDGSKLDETEQDNTK